MSVTSQLCEKIAGTGYADLGAPAIAAARRLVLDGIAIAIAGTEEEAIQILAAHFKEQGGRASRRRPSATATASTRCRRRRSTARPCTCSTSSRCGARPTMRSRPRSRGALALAEARGMSGREVLTALVKGVEMQGWIRQASGQFEAHKIRFHPPGAAGSARRRGGGRTPARARCRPARQCHRHLPPRGPAAVLANVGTMTKSTHCGHAAALGPGGGAARRARLHGQRRRVRGRTRLRRRPSTTRTSRPRRC